MIISVATVNDNEFTKGSNYPDVAFCDVVLIQEGRAEDYTKLVDRKTHGVLQDHTNLATAGSVIIWALATITMQKTGLTFGVKAKGLLTRYLAWLRALVGGRRVLFIAAHRPPKRAQKFWHRFDLALAARVRLALLVGRVVIVGIDANEGNPQRLARLCGLTWHSTGPRRIDGFLVSASVTVLSIRALPKDTSDHQPVVAEMSIPSLGPLHYPAITAARDQSHNGPQFGEGECLQQVRTCYSIGPKYRSASDAWYAAIRKHPTADVKKMPRGYPVFWTGGSHGFGHVAIATGDGHCWSTDILRVGYFDYVPISLIHEKWGLALVGWTEDLNGELIPVPS